MKRISDDVREEAAMLLALVAACGGKWPDLSDVLLHVDVSYEAVTLAEDAGLAVADHVISEDRSFACDCTEAAQLLLEGWTPGEPLERWAPYHEIVNVLDAGHEVLAHIARLESALAQAANTVIALHEILEENGMADDEEDTADVLAQAREWLALAGRPVPDAREVTAQPVDADTLPPSEPDAVEPESLLDDQDDEEEEEDDDDEVEEIDFDDDKFRQYRDTEED